LRITLLLEEISININKGSNRKRYEIHYQTTNDNDLIIDRGFRDAFYQQSQVGFNYIVMLFFQAELSEISYRGHLMVFTSY
jgi:hypothetical protein